MWDNFGVELPRSVPGGVFSYTLPARYACNGTLGFNAYCPTLNVWRDWTPWTGATAADAGFQSVRLASVELATSSLVCNFFEECSFGAPSYWTTPRVPLHSATGAACDVSPYPCPAWCDGDDYPDPRCH